MSICALSTNSNPTESCFAKEHEELITNYTTANTISELKKQINCDDDMCLIEKVNIPEKIKQKIQREAFKADAKGFDDNYWLNNTEIDTVMSQLRHKFKGFSHGFIHMIDIKAFPPSNLHSFDYEVYQVDEIDLGCEFSDALIKRGLIKGTPSGKPSKLSTYNNEPVCSYGIICNTDSSKGSGQHWFTIYISTDHKDPNDTSRPWVRIELFNSGGTKPDNAEFNKFWEKVALDIAQKANVKCTYDLVSNIKHQKDDTGNCGSYSLFYIYSRLQDCHPKEFNQPSNPITDYAMRKFREVCFKKSESLF